MEGINISTHPDVPGEPTQTGTSILETATATIQGFGPINKIHQHLCALSFYYSILRFFIITKFIALITLVANLKFLIY